MYLTYAEYQAQGGTITDVATFNDLEFGAEALINYYTFNRLKNNTEIPIEVKRLTKYLIDLAQKKADALSLGDSADENTTVGTYITEQSNDGVSTKYSGMASADLYKLCNEEADGAIKQYLYGVMNELGRKLLYRGLYPGE